MRRDSDIRRRVARLGILLALAIAGPSSAQDEAAEPDPALRSEWIPERASDLDVPETLDEPSGAARVALSFVGAPDASRRFRWRSNAVSAALFHSKRGIDAGATVRRRAIAFAAGAIATTGWGLAGERARLSRRERARPGAESPGEPFSASGGSGADFDGVAIAWRPAPGSRLRSVPAVARIAAGARRRAEGRFVAGSFGLPLAGAGRASASFLVTRAGSAEAIRSVGGLRLAGTHGTAEAESRASLEIAGDGESMDLGIDAAFRSRGFRAEGRWRRRGTASPPAGLELEAAWSAPRAGARFRWRAWGTASNPLAKGDDARAELDLRAGRGAPGSWRLRAGSRPRGLRGSGGERLLLGEMVAARERGRVLRLTAAARASQSGAAWRVGRMLGGSLLLERPRRASLDLRIEAVRVERDAGVPGGSFEVAGAGSIRTRSRNGVRVAARGWIERGAWRVGVALDDEETEQATTAGARAARARLWLTWNGDAGSR